MSGSATTSIEAAWWIAAVVPTGLIAMFAVLGWASRTDGRRACPARLAREAREAQASTLHLAGRDTEPTRPAPVTVGVAAGLWRTA